MWILNHYAVAPGTSGGTRHFSLARSVLAAGGEATIFASGYHPSAGTEDRLRSGQAVRSQTIAGVPFVWLRTTPYKGNTVFRMLNMLSYSIMVGLASMGRPRPDVVLGSTVHPFAALAGWVLARRHGARFVYEIRDLWPQTLVDLGAMSPRSPIAKVLWAIETFLVRRADIVLTLLPGIASYLDERGLPVDHVHYLPNGMDLALERERISAGTVSAPGPEVVAVERARSEGRTIFTYVGAHGRVNALHTVLEAFQLAQRSSAVPMRLIMIGDGPEKERLEASARAMVLDDVTWLEPIPKSRVSSFLSSVDVGIVHATKTPVYRYGISFNKLFDYMGARLPVVFACDSSNDPVKESGCGLSCPPDDPIALAQAMVQLAGATKAERTAMGEAGRAVVEESHDLAKLGDELVAMLWPEIAAGTRPARSASSASGLL